MLSVAVSSIVCQLGSRQECHGLDGRGAWRDNVIVERSVKYEEVYLRVYGAVSEARASIGGYLAFYNSKRPHSSLAAKIPDQTYFDTLPLAMAA